MRVTVTHEHIFTDYTSREDGRQPIDPITEAIQDALVPGCTVILDASTVLIVGPDNQSYSTPLPRIVAAELIIWLTHHQMSPMIFDLDVPEGLIRSQYGLEYHHDGSKKREGSTSGPDGEGPDSKGSESVTQT